MAIARARVTDRVGKSGSAAIGMRTFYRVSRLSLMAAQTSANVGLRVIQEAHYRGEAIFVRRVVAGPFVPRQGSVSFGLGTPLILDHLYAIHKVCRSTP
jgi:hypothetical protein